MTFKLNHTIVHAYDKKVSAQFFMEIFDVPEPRPFAHFLIVDLANEVTLDFRDSDEKKIQWQHYAFLVSEVQFDQIFGRVKARGLDYWADPTHLQKGEINHIFGGRGVYFNDPAGHYLEIFTRPPIPARGIQASGA